MGMASCAVCKIIGKGRMKQAVSKYLDKYHMTQEQAYFLAKKRWDEGVYCGMRMENRAITFPQTQTILQGVNVPEVRIDDIQAVLNMRDAWKFVINNPTKPISIEYWYQLNGFIARNEALEWGKLRTGSVAISGTDYVPPVPTEEDVRTQLQQILNSETTVTEKALNAFVWGTRGQFFWDGNKRTSLILANKILLDSGAGMLIVQEKYIAQFNVLLLDYYNSGESSVLKDFLYRNAIHGIVFH